MYEFKIGIDPKRHDTFVQAHPLANLLQSASWAKIKENWKSTIVGIEADGTLIASALVLIKSLPLGFTMLYLPRGPIMDYEDASVVTFFIQELKKYAKTQKGLFIKMDPGIHYKELYADDTVITNDKVPTILKNLQAAGAIHQPLSLDMDATIQPRFQASVNQDGFEEATLPKSMRKMLNIARKKHVMVDMCGIEQVVAFSEIMNATTKRQQIALRSEAYFKRLLQVYGENAFLMMASLDLRAVYKLVKERYDQNKSELKTCPSNAKKKRFTLEELDVSLTREVLELERWIQKYGDKVFIAGALVVVYGVTSELLYAGMNEEFKRYMAPYITWYEAMRACFGKGCKFCNMGGIDGSLKDGLTKFKTNFNPVINEYIGEFDIPVNSVLYKASKRMYQLRKAKNTTH